MLTAEAVRKLKPTAARQEIADRHGLYLIVQKSGAKSWAFRGRVKGRPMKLTLGRYPDVDLTAARDLAGDARKAAHAGRVFSPPEPKATPEGAPEAPEGFSLREVWAQYRAHRLEPECRKSTVAEHCRIFEAHIGPTLGGRNIGSILKTDVLPITDAALARGFEARNKTIAVLTGFFNWATDERDLIERNPLRGIKQRTSKKYNNVKRSLTHVEIKAFWRACDVIDEQNLATVRFGAMFKLLLLTGARRNEVAGMRWDEIDGDAWTLPGERAKNGKPLRVHLTTTTQAILRHIPRTMGCSFVFGPTGKSCGFGYSKAKERLDAVAGIKSPWRLHDLRRTCRTGLGRLGVAEEIAERCINHPPAGLSAIYDQHRYEAEMATAWQRWEKHVLKVAR
jgi:integrase